MSNAHALAACVVSFNPDANVLEVLEVCKQQVLEVFVVDNHSAQGKREWLAQACKEGHMLLVENGENRGVAGALNQAAAMAIDRGFEWLLVLDQDSVPPTDLVERLMREAEGTLVTEQVAILCPISVGNDVSLGSVTSGTMMAPVDSAMSAGSVIRLEAWKAVGGYDEGFFVDYVDHDFCFKCRQNGWKIMQAKDVVIVHSPGSPTRHHFLWKRPLVSNHTPLRRYYITRNRILFYRRYWHFAPRWIICDVFHAVKEAVAIMLFESDKHSKLTAIGAGILDGLRGISGQVQQERFVVTSR